MSQGLNLKNAISSALSRVFSFGKINLLKKGSAQVTIEGLTLDGVPFVQHYGQKSSPPPGTRCFTISNGNQQTVIILGTENNGGPDLNPGDSAIYSASAVVHCTKDGVTISGDKIKVDAKKEVEIIGDKVKLKLKNSLRGGALVTKNCICAFTGSSHPEGESAIEVERG